MVKLLAGEEAQVRLLKDELRRMQSLVIDASKRQGERVRNLISEVRELAQEGEDMIEMFLIDAEHESNIGFFKGCITSSKRMHHLDKIGEHIKKIHQRLRAHGIREILAEPESSLVEHELQRRWKNNEHLVGMEGHVEKLLRASILDEEKKCLSVAVVHGIGGIGKSTLAREIYNHPDVVARFDCRRFVVASYEFTPREMLKQLILQLPECDEQKQSIRELEKSAADELYIQKKLRDMLQKPMEGKSYFIVVDDLWEESHWRFFSNFFPDEQGKPSRILLTTRNKAILKYCQYAHKMEKLDPEKSWELLLKSSLINGKCPEELESIGGEIVDKCHGLPLAINTIGGLLVGTTSTSRWEQILKQTDSLLGSAESTVATILELSYLRLSPRLKPCFLSLAFFKEDATIPVMDLINVWIGQGLIEIERRGTTLEETARGYLDELINRSMVEVKNWTLDDRVDNCRLPSLIRHVCVRKAEEEIGFHIQKEENIGVSSESSLHKARHCALLSGDFSVNQNNHLRSLFLLNTTTTQSDHDWKRFQLLKILYMDFFHHIGTLPPSFQCLVGLKYLRVRSPNSQLELPFWLSKLRKLEVLDMDGMTALLPKAPLEMESLRCFCAQGVIGLKMLNKWQNIETLKHISERDWRKYNSRLGDCRVRELGIHLESRK